MPSWNHCAHEIPLALQGGQASRPSHPSRLQAQGCQERKLDTESPTVSRLGKYLKGTLSCIKRWKKSAFLQSDYITEEVEIYGEPSADMRRLKEHEVMQMTKPAFGDVRAPRQWNDTADRALAQEVKLWKHELDGCIYNVSPTGCGWWPSFRSFRARGQQLCGGWCLLHPCG